MYFNEAILVEFKDPNAKIKRMVFETSDQTLVRSALRALQVPQDQFTLKQITQNKKVQ